ncbi:leucine rich repeat protein [Peptostreptococcaceae bacterium AS15]|nr:leucine rich repeat protein [Peptostreptococcaceae bacterium AS15]
MKRRVFAFFLIILSLSIFSLAWVYADRDVDNISDRTEATYEQLFLDPNLAKLIATYTNSDVGDIVNRKKLSEIRELSNIYNGSDVVDNIFHLSGISNLPNLEKIDLPNMKVISIPDEIKSLKKLKYIDVSNNQLIYVSDFIDSLPLLEELHIDNNNLDINLRPVRLENLKKYSFSDQNTEIGNVPEKFIPQSNITFGANGEPILTEVVKAAPVLPGEKELDGVEWEDYIPQVDDMVERLPVFEVKDYYIAKSGARAQYGSEGELIRVRGDYDYISDIDKYVVDGKYQNGKYVGNFTEFSISDESDIRQVPSELLTEKTIKKPIRGFFTTYGDFWPKIPSSDKSSNSDPVPKRGKTEQDQINYYGDRIGTRNNKLKIGDVAARPADKIPYNSTIHVTVIDEKTNKKFERDMRVRDIMGATKPVLDIWRWDNPDWFTGKPHNPNDVYFGKKYTKYTSFSNKNNFYTYEKK